MMNIDIRSLCLRPVVIAKILFDLNFCDIISTVGFRFFCGMDMPSFKSNPCTQLHSRLHSFMTGVCLPGHTN